MPILLLLSFGTKYRWVAIVMLWTFDTQGRSSSSPFDRKVGGPSVWTKRRSDKQGSRAPNKILSLRYSRPSKLKALDSFETSEIDYPLSQRRMPKEFSSKKYPSIVRTWSTTDAFLFVDRNIRPRNHFFTTVVYVTDVLTFDSSCKDSEIRSCPLCDVSLGNISNCGSAHPSVSVHLTRYCNDMPVCSYSSRVASARYNSQPAVRFE